MHETIKFSLIGLTTCLLIACAGTSNTNRQPSPSGVPFPAPIADFALWQQQVEDHITPLSLAQRNPEHIKLNLPLELNANPAVSYRGKFLLMHGLNDSAYVWRDLSEELARLGFDVRAILLPGHGSHPRNMLDVSYKDWLSVTSDHLKLWATDDTPIFLGGFSLGAVLATALALDNPSVDGLLLVSPAYHSKLNHLLRWSFLYKRFRPWMFGGMILEDNPIKYNSIPINSGDQYFRTTRHLKNRWGKTKLDIPVLAISTMNDSVVDVSYTRELLDKRFKSPKKQLILYTDSADTLIPRFHESVRNSVFMEKRILNQSHLSLINKPSNPMMGENGSLLICNGNDMKTFFGCMADTDHWFGAQHTLSPDAKSVARTSYNPDFEYLIKAIDNTF